MKSKEEIIEMYKAELFNTLKGFDTKENVEKYIDGIDKDITYDVLLMDTKEPFNCTMEQAIERDCNYHYMMYPDY